MYKVSTKFHQIQSSLTFPWVFSSFMWLPVNIFLTFSLVSILSNLEILKLYRNFDTLSTIFCSQIKFPWLPWQFSKFPDCFLTSPWISEFPDTPMYQHSNLFWKKQVFRTGPTLVSSLLLYSFKIQNSLLLSLWS